MNFGLLCTHAFSISMFFFCIHIEEMSFNSMFCMHENSIVPHALNVNVRVRATYLSKIERWKLRDMMQIWCACFQGVEKLWMLFWLFIVQLMVDGCFFWLSSMVQHKISNLCYTAWPLTEWNTEKKTLFLWDSPIRYFVLLFFFVVLSLFI